LEDNAGIATDWETQAQKHPPSRATTGDFDLDFDLDFGWWSGVVVPDLIF
jgi:hypothetical protein